MNNSESSVALSAKSLALSEIISVIVSCLIAEWVILSFLSLYRWLVIVPVALAIAFISLSHQAYGERLKELGFRFDNFLSSARFLLWPTFIAVIIILTVGWYLVGPPAISRLMRPRFLLIPAWALIQQYALQGFINRRAQVVFGKGTASVVLVAILFALLHLPNPVLSILTLIGGLIWAAVYQQQANLFALAASHTVASITLAVSLPLNVINGLRVGFKYFG